MSETGHPADPAPGETGDRKPAATGPAPRGTRWLRIALVASLTLNLLILGIVGGAAFRFWRNPPRPPVAEVGFGPYTEALDRKDRRALRDAFVAQMPGLRDLRRESRNDVRDLIAALRADPWDPDAARAVLAKRVKRTSERLELGQSLLLARLDSMTPADRQAFAGRLEEMQRRPVAPGGNRRDGTPGTDGD